MPRSESPSLDLVRAATDRAVLDQLFRVERRTRAEIAATTGISKPTVSQAIRRLADSGFVADAGRQVGGRGRAGTYCRLRDGLGCALAVHAGPDGITTETVTLGEQVTGRHTQALPTPAPTTPTRLAAVLRSAVQTTLATVAAPVLVTTLSVADPVDRRTGELIGLPDSPFVAGKLDLRAVLAGLPIGRLVVDNDVNWATLAEHRVGCAQDLTDFAYVYLGAGIGAGILVDGMVMSGSRGFAGELAYVLTRGPGGRAMRLLDCFAHWGLTGAETTAIDVDRVAELLRAGSAGRPRAQALGAAVAGAIASLVTLLDPAAVVLGGPWGGLAQTRALIERHLHGLAAVPVLVRTATTTAAAPLTGARLLAIDAAREHVLGLR